MIGRRVTEHGIMVTIRYFSKQFVDIDLKGTSVQRLKNNHLQVSELKCKRAESSEIVELSPKKRGHLLLLGDELDKQLKVFLLSLHSCDAMVNMEITLACA